MPQDGMANTMLTPEMLPVWLHMDDVPIANLAVRVSKSTNMPSKGCGDKIRGSKPKKSEVAKEIKMIRRVCQGVSKIDRKGLYSLH